MYIIYFTITIISIQPFG